jgi:hypothetical protein
MNRKETREALGITKSGENYLLALIKRGQVIERIKAAQFSGNEKKIAELTEKFTQANKEVTTTRDEVRKEQGYK